MDIYGGGCERVCDGWCVEWVAWCSDRCGAGACPNLICFVNAEGSHDAVQSMCCNISMAEDILRNALDLWRSENEVCCCHQGRFLVKQGCGRRQGNNSCGGR